MGGVICCYNMVCQKEVEYWVQRADYSLNYPDNTWYPFCKEHLIYCIKKRILFFDALQDQRIRHLNTKSIGKKKTIINWKMFIDWELICDEVDFFNPLSRKVFETLPKFHHEKFVKFKKHYGPGDQFLKNSKKGTLEPFLI